MRRDRKPAFIGKQAGFLVPLAIFIVVALGALAVTIARMAGTAQHMSIREALSTQTFFAAESAMNLAIYQLYAGTSPTDPLSTSYATANCLTIDVASRNFNVTGLKACSAIFDCASTTDGVQMHYQLTVTASCGSGDLASSRSLTVKATLK